MLRSDFEYDLPQGRIAQGPAVPRDASRLLVLPGGGPVEHRGFRELPLLLKPGDLLVVNDTRGVKWRPAVGAATERPTRAKTVW